MTNDLVEGFMKTILLLFLIILPGGAFAMFGCADTVFCLDCFEKHSSVIGNPNLKNELSQNYKEHIKKQVNAPMSYYIENEPIYERVNFGFIYEGLTLLKMHSYSVESYHAFLKKHSGHNVRAYSTYDDADNPLPKNIGEKYDKFDIFEYNDSYFKESFYELHCKTCNLTSRIDHNNPIKILQFEEFEITKEIIEKFEEKVFFKTGYMDDIYVNYELQFDLLNFRNNIDNLNSFLDMHREHKIIVRLSNEESNIKIVTQEMMDEEKHKERKKREKRVESCIKEYVANNVSSVKDKEKELFSTMFWFYEFLEYEYLASSKKNSSDLSQQEILEIYKLNKHKKPEY